MALLSWKMSKMIVSVLTSSYVGVSKARFISAIAIIFEVVEFLTKRGDSGVSGDIKQLHHTT